jgi:hypothetical protein
MSEVSLKKCDREGCNPVLQVRGKMEPKDHHMQFNRVNAAEEFQREHGVGLPIADFHADAHDVEDAGPEHASDMRVSCSKCGKATGWDRVDIEKFENRAPGHTVRVVVERDGNKENIVNRWNASV